MDEIKENETKQLMAIPTIEMEFKKKKVEIDIKKNNVTRGVF